MSKGIRYVCYECKKEVPKDHYTTTDGRILCKKCAEKEYSTNKLIKKL